MQVSQHLDGIFSQHQHTIAYYPVKFLIVGSLDGLLRIGNFELQLHVFEPLLVFYSALIQLEVSRNVLMRDFYHVR